MNSDLVLGSLSLALQCLASQFIDRAAPAPYMDEIFHVPQAQRYCRHIYHEYDSKLTTPPGLYLLSAAVSSIGIPCTLNALRLQNVVVGAVALPLLLRMLQRCIYKTHALPRFIFAFMPVLSFFSLLYYTDVMSTCLVLATLVSLSQHWMLVAATTAFASLWLRQTNLVWVIMVLAHDALSAGNFEHDSWQALVHRVGGLLRQPVSLAQRYVAFVPVALFSVAFLWWNGSIVLGDKSNHVAGVHPVQLLWMMSFCIGMNWPLFVSWRSLRAWRLLFARPLLLAACLLGCYTAVRHTDPHPFILADNRHYTFYINRWLLSRLPTCIQALAYTFVGALWFDALATTSLASQVMIFGGSVLSLVPSPLLEFRYYLLPYLLWSMYATPETFARRRTLLVCWFWIVHGLTVALFVFRPFAWPSEPDVQQHFMW